MEFLTIQEVAQILKSHTNTIYKMCREGTLPCVKIGKEWRIDRDKFERFMEDGIEKDTKGPFQGIVNNVLTGGHVLGVFTEKDSILEFELELFKQAPKEGSRFLKACWWQHPDDVRQHLINGGLPVVEMEASGSFIIVNLSKIFCSSGPVKAAEEWIIATKDALAKGFKRLIGSGSPHFECCGSHNALMEFEGSLDKGLEDLPVAGVCSYFMESGIPSGFSRLVDLIKKHDRFFIKTADKEILAKTI